MAVSKRYEVRPDDKNPGKFVVDLIGEIEVAGFPTFDSAAGWLHGFIMQVISGQLTALVAAQARGRQS